MDDHSVGIVPCQSYTFAEPPHAMRLDSGESLGPITLAYETYGALNAARSNAILITHALSGDAHVAGYHAAGDRKPGWWDTMVGPGKAFDTNRYFVICSNVLGGCQGSTGPASVNPATGKPYGLDFPVITVGDMVTAQRELLRHLSVERLLCVAGGSMGGMQVLEWITRFPDATESAMVIASTHLSGAQQIAFDAVGRHAIRADRDFNRGQYYAGPAPDKGLAIARMLAHITYLSDESMREKFGRTLRHDGALHYDFDSEFAVETYLDYQGEQFVNRFDANTYLYVTKAMDYFDISARFGSLDMAMAAVKCKTLVLAYSSDWLYPPYQSEQITYALARAGADVSYCNIESDYGHDAFLLEVDVMTRIIQGFLNHTRPASTKKHVDGFAGERKDERQSSIYSGGHRVDYDMIVGLVGEGSSVLDFGCGDGALLARLIAEKNVHGLGIELDQENVVRAMQRGVPVIQADIDKGLSELADNSFDCVIMSMTLQVVEHPGPALQELLRVGKTCIVSFPNFAHWHVRNEVFLRGRSPITPNLPYEWWNTPNRHFFSIKDFRNFCRNLNIRIVKELPLNANGVTRIWPNYFAEEALYVIASN